MKQAGTESTEENRGRRGALPEPTEEWSEPQPAAIPPPTYWPVTLAFGTTLAGLSLVTSYLFSARRRSADDAGPVRLGRELRR